jgi:uncharacterized beta-barrel protein YwiB (DUF1934 family)
MKTNVIIELNHQSEAEQFSQSIRGHFYEVPPIGYLRYTEPDPQMGVTNTTIRILPDELRMQRRGSVESLFVFRPGERTRVSYRFGTTQMQMIAHTRQLDFYWSNGAGSIQCHYELWQQDELLDRIELQIKVSPI